MLPKGAIRVEVDGNTMVARVKLRDTPAEYMARLQADQDERRAARAATHENKRYDPSTSPWAVPTDTAQLRGIIRTELYKMASEMVQGLKPGQ